MSCRLSAVSAQTHPSTTGRTDAALQCFRSQGLQKNTVRERLGQGSKGHYVIYEAVLVLYVRHLFLAESLISIHDCSPRVYWTGLWLLA